MNSFRFTFILSLLLIGCTTTTTTTIKDTAQPEQVKDEPWEPDKRAGVHVQLARGYMEIRKNDVALVELDQALEISPNHVDANHVMAVLQQKLGNSGRAENYFRTALVTKPNNFSVNMDFGSFLCTNGKEQEAMQQFQRALADPFNRQLATVYLRSGSCMLMHNKLTSAEEYFRKALGLQPKLGPALFNMAQLQYKRHNYMSARAYIERYLDLGRDDPRSLMQAINVEKQLGDAVAAEKYAKRLRQKFPNSKEAQSLSQPFNKQLAK